MNTKSLLLAASLMAFWNAHAQIQIGVDVAQKGVKVSPTLYGIFFEDINHAADGGLYAELIRNRSFEDDERQPVNWSTVGHADVRLIDEHLLNKAQEKALQVNFKGGLSGVSNEGFWGINAVQGRTYRLSFWAKGQLKGQLQARLTSADGRQVLAQTAVTGRLGKQWTKYTATLTSTGNDAKTRFELVSEGKGTICLDVVSLFPPTFRQRANGMRPDLAQMLYDLHPKFMRFPGGCFVEGQDSPANAYHWEQTIGPIEERPGHKNVNWRYRTSDGMGFDEYLQLAEDLGAKPLYVVNVGLWHGGKTSIDSLQPWIDEALRALEYANGPVTSKYGALRAKNGHPQPYNIEYLEIGNENNQPDPNAQSDHYYERFKLFKEAILARYPNMHLIGNVVAWGDDHPKWGSAEQVELLDEHYYRNPAWFANNFHKYDTYSRQGEKIYVGEYAVTQGFGHVGNLNAALGEAVYMMGMENNSDIVTMASYAPIFANLHDRMWAPDMIQFNGVKALGTPSYYVQKLMADHVGTRVLPVVQTNPYESQWHASTVAPRTSRVGVATWGTQASFRWMGFQTKGGCTMTKGDEQHPIDFVSGEWQLNDGQLSQTSEKENCLAIGTPKITADGTYELHLKARKDGGNEGFMVVFNYVDKDNYCWANFGGWGNTLHGIEQVRNGIKSQQLTTPGRIQTGHWYDVVLRLKGDSVYASLDGEQVMAAKLKDNTAQGIYSNATYDEPSGEVILKVVNNSPIGTTAQVRLAGYMPTAARIVRLTADKGTEENTIESPTHVYPTDQYLNVVGSDTAIDIPAFSLNIIRFKK